MQYVQTGLEVLGAFGVFATALGTVLPQSWRLTRLCARLGADLRGIHQGTKP